MRVLFLDLDTLRPDHLGCYGYGRNTSPNIDSVAKEGVTFDEYYCPNAPCLPSRASLISGKFGIRNGVVGHGGTAAEMIPQGKSRDFRSEFGKSSLFFMFRNAGMRTASISCFAERHSAWWFYAGFNECYNIGRQGWESAEEAMPTIQKWLSENVQKDNWMLHLNLWDAHTPYRAPKEYGNPFENEPLCQDWIDEKIFESHKYMIGPHGRAEMSLNLYDDSTSPKFPRYPGALHSLDDVKRVLDNYDTGIQYMDSKIGEILQMLKDAGVYDDTAIIITSDHGENMGELGIYGDHMTADYVTGKIPMIIKWPNGKKNIRENGFHSNVDLLPTVADLLNVKKPTDLDGTSYAPAILEGKKCGSDHVVITQAAHVLQRSARFDDYIYIRTFHGGFHLFEEEMLFNVKEDPHEINNIAELHPELCAQGARIIFNWQNEMLMKSDLTVDPFWLVNAEGGPQHTTGFYESYRKRLTETGREDLGKLLDEKYKDYEARNLNFFQKQ